MGKKFLMAATLAVCGLSLIAVGPAVAGNTNNSGGAGGSGTGVGVGVGVGVGIGGDSSASVSGSGNSSNRNVNRNVNRNDVTGLNLQGQQQGIDSDISNKNRQGQGQNQDQGQGQQQSTDNANNADQSVTVEGDTYEAAEIPVASAYAPGLSAGAATCMGSTSAGGQTMGWGLSIGSTWNDSKCDARMDAATLMGLGLGEAAVARICQDGDMRKAVADAGGQCPVAPAQAESAEGQANLDAGMRADAPYWCKGETSQTNALYDDECV